MPEPHDGTVSDSEMDRDTVTFLADHVDAKLSTLVADSKIVNGPLILLLVEKEFGFVSKCPKSFGDNVRTDIEYSIMSSQMEPSSNCDGWEVYDCDAVVDGIPLRFVAYRTAEGIDHDMEYLKVQGEREVSKAFKVFEKRTFACEDDARRAFDDALEGLGPSAYIVTAEARAERVVSKYGKHGRPPKDWRPEIRTEYRVDVSWEFSEALAEEMSAARQVRVLVTILPRSRRHAGSRVTRWTADDVLRIYMGQYRIEHAFRTDKSEFEIDTVYFHRPSRANAFFFVVSLCTMVSGIIDTVMRNAGVMKTAQGMIDDLSALIVKSDRADSDIILSGDDVLIDEYLRYRSCSASIREDCSRTDGCACVRVTRTRATPATDALAHHGKSKVGCRIHERTKGRFLSIVQHTDRAGRQPLRGVLKNNQYVSNSGTNQIILSDAISTNDSASLLTSSSVLYLPKETRIVPSA